MQSSEITTGNSINSEALTGLNLKVTINPDAYDKLDILVDRYKKQLPPYDEIILPQEYKPDSMMPGNDHYCGGLKHAMFFWNMCSYMQGGVKADQAFKKMAELFDENQDYFDCQFLSQSNPRDVSDELAKYRLGRQYSVADHWIKNAIILKNRYDGDPRKIFDGVDTYEGCVERIKHKGEDGFYGFQEKMTSMILYYYMNEGLVPDVKFPVPVDFHALRVVLATEMATVEPCNFYTYSHVVQDSLRELFQGYLEAREVCPLDLTNSVWLLSSNLCSKSFGNRPIESKEGNAFRNLSPEELRQSKSWQRSCGKCAIEQYCRYYISSEPYYSKGAIYMIDKKDLGSDPK